MSKMSENTKENLQEFNNAMVQLRSAEEKFNEAIQNVWNIMTKMAEQLNAEAQKMEAKND